LSAPLLLLLPALPYKLHFNFMLINPHYILVTNYGLHLA
jgi:hypothetical protein